MAKFFQESGKRSGAPKGVKRNALQIAIYVSGCTGKEDGFTLSQPISRSDLKFFYLTCSTCFGQESDGEEEASSLLASIGRKSPTAAHDKLYTTVGDFADFLAQKFSAFPEHLKEIKQVVAAKLKPTSSKKTKSELTNDTDSNPSQQFAKLSSWQMGKRVETTSPENNNEASSSLETGSRVSRKRVSSVEKNNFCVSPPLESSEDTTKPLDSKKESPEVAAVRQEMQAKIDELERKMNENLRHHHKLLKSILCASKERESAAVAEAIHKTKLQIRARIQARRRQQQHKVPASPPPPPSQRPTGAEDFQGEKENLVSTAKALKVPSLVPPPQRAPLQEQAGTTLERRREINYHQQEQKVKEAGRQERRKQRRELKHQNISNHAHAHRRQRERRPRRVQHRPQASTSRLEV